MKPGKTLSQRVVKGGFWVFSLRITQQAFSLIRLIILARILSPNDFGLMGIALLVMATLDTFSQTGFQQALIQKKKDIKSYLDSAWTILILRGFVLFTILYFIAPYAAIFFKASQAKLIIQVIGFSVLLQAFTNIGVIYFQKELEFNKQFIYQLAGTLADFIVAVSAVLILRNVWALVFGLLAGNAARCIMSYLIHPYRPHLSKDLGKAKELFGFGKWILGSSILIFLITQGDDIFVGKLLGATMLGFYQMAYRISNMPATEITHVISQVTFPAYSKLQDNIPKLREAYLKVLQVTAFLSFPIAGMIFVLAPDFTKIFLGEKWMPMVPAMQVLVIWGLIRSVGATTGPIFQGVGKPRIVTKIQFVQLILLFILIYPLSIHYGITGTALSVVFAALIANLVSSCMVIKLTKCGVRNFCKMIIFPLITMAVIFSPIFIMKIYWIDSVGILEFFLFIMFGILVYSGIAYLFDKFYGYGIGLIIKENLTSFRVRGKINMTNNMQPTKLFVNFTKLPFHLIKQFYYRNLQIRNREKVLRDIYSCNYINKVLKTEEEVEESFQNVKKLKLEPHNDRPKNWDCYRAFSFILRHGNNKESKILDVGSADYGVILPWLELYGFLNLYGIDISFKNDFRKSKIRYYKQDLQKTNFPSNFFDFITSISVIEHGVDIDVYLKETSRLLKKGGYLLTSTDYWSGPIDTRGLYPYGKKLGEMKVFTREDIEKLVRRAQKHGLELIEPIDFSERDKVVYWRRVDKKFTYIFFILRKEKFNINTI